MLSRGFLFLFNFVYQTYITNIQSTSNPTCLSQGAVRCWEPDLLRGQKPDLFRGGGHKPDLFLWQKPDLFFWVKHVGFVPSTQRQVGFLPLGKKAQTRLVSRFPHRSFFYFCFISDCILPSRVFAQGKKAKTRLKKISRVFARGEKGKNPTYFWAKTRLKISRVFDIGPGTSRVCAHHSVLTSQVVPIN